MLDSVLETIDSSYSFGLPSEMVLEKDTKDIEVTLLRSERTLHPRR